MQQDCLGLALAAFRAPFIVQINDNPRISTMPVRWSTSCNPPRRAGQSLPGDMFGTDVHTALHSSEKSSFSAKKRNTSKLQTVWIAGHSFFASFVWRSLWREHEHKLDRYVAHCDTMYFPHFTWFYRCDKHHILWAHLPWHRCSFSTPCALGSLKLSGLFCPLLLSQR